MSFCKRKQLSQQKIGEKDAKILNWLEKVLTPMAKTVGENKYLIAIRDGFLLSTPLLIVGSLFLVLTNFPIPNWNEWMAGFLGENWAVMLNKPATASFDIMTILAVGGIGYSLAKQFKVDAMQAAIISLVSFFIVTPFTTLFTQKVRLKYLKSEVFFTLDGIKWFIFRDGSCFSSDSYVRCLDSYRVDNQNARWRAAYCC